ncbi:PTS sugar transporter subunit IIC [Paenibacillus sp. 28ISP30-2]|uniref:PTS sugar transporter subunit IIC n=1 Tax=Paenibacillus sp. 23TSA30-6 TaxID=2546104 RepID=UPI00178800D6|nr:PTS transporter subunit EIIC [Paenibacillus sp. 23TSA30-6]MBE0336732.1 PTS sugar transporter subunit IIC [Paenibacillus sp. 23TSA30-6]MBE0341548.1 PTS sugar transporter subunit IIC [Paenibacillus sp. 28ISP30-2]
MAISIESFTEKLQQFAGVLQDNKYFDAISKGLMGTMPIIFVGSIAALVNALPIDAYQSFITDTGLKNYLQLATKLTTDMIALYAVFSIAYSMSKNYKQDGLNAGILALLSFLVVTPLDMSKDGAFSLPFQWLGATGLFISIIMGLMVGRLYALLLKKGISIKMPDGVPPSVAKSFAGLIPGLVIIAVDLCINGLFNVTSYGNIHNFVYHLLQTPLQNLGGTYWAFILTIGLLSQILWVVGIHGGMVCLSVMMPIFMALDLQNLSAYSAGQPLPNIVGMNFMLVYGIGAGCSIGLAILLVVAKSERYKALSKIAFPSAIFGISEPTIFGAPIILNPVLAIPFIVSPIISYTLAYFLTTMDVLPRLGLQVPLGLPPIINGFMSGGWRVALFQVFLILISLVTYYPFFKSLDKHAKKEELGGAA